MNDALPNSGTDANLIRYLESVWSEKEELSCKGLAYYMDYFVEEALGPSQAAPHRKTVCEKVEMTLTPLITVSATALVGTQMMIEARFEKDPQGRIFGKIWRGRKIEEDQDIHSRELLAKPPSKSHLRRIK